MGVIIHNLLATVGTIIYVKSITFACSMLVKYNIVGVKLSRKLIHVLAGTWMLTWQFFDRSEGYSWMFAMTAPLIYAIVLLYKGLFLTDREDNDVRSMSRSGDPRELLAGPLYYLIVMCVIGFQLFMTRIGVLTLSTLSFGDGLAPYFGERFGGGESNKNQQYTTFGRQKTYVGSGVMLIASFLGGLLMHFCVFGWPSAYLIGAHLVASAVATLAEAFSPSDIDNITVPLTAYFTLRILGIH